MSDDLSLLLKLRGDNAQLKTTIADSRTAVAQLRQSFGPQLTQTLTVANKAFSDLDGNLRGFVSQHLPLLGGSVLRVSDTLRAFGNEGPKTEKALGGIAKSIESIAAQSGKSVPQIASFLKTFVQIEGQAARSGAATDFFGASLATKLLPQLEQTGAAVGEVSGEAAAMGSSLAALAGPIGIVVIALAALVASAVVTVDKLAELTVQTAEWQGALIDLSQQTGFSVEILNSLEIALSKVGGNLSSATQALIAFQRNLDEAQDVSTKAGQTFFRLGISTTDTETAFRETLKALARMPEGFSQTNTAAELFGSRGGKQILAVLKELHGDIDAAVADLGNLGKVTTEQAKRADDFNDALRDVQILLRGASAVLVREVIPTATSALKDLQKLIKDNEAAFKALGTAIDLAATSIGAFVRGSLFTLNAFLATHRAEFELTAAIFERIASALKTIRGTQDTEPLKNAMDGLKLLQDAQEAFNKGLKPFNIKEIFGVDDKTIKASKDALNEQLGALQEAIDTRQLTFQDETETIRRELAARSISFNQYYDQQKARNEKQVNDTLENLKIESAAVRNALARGVIDANEAAQKQRQIASDEREVRRAADKEQQRLDDEKVALRRKQDQATIDVLRDTVDTQLRILAIGDDRRIESIRALADLRVKTEEDAERRVLQIRLGAIDREKQRLQTEVGILEKNKTSDPEEVLKQKAHLNLEIRRLDEERAFIEEHGEREIEAGRQRDIQNERDYADELKEIKARIRDIELDTAQEVIRLMRLHFASRKDIIRAQRDLDLQEEDERHRRVTDSIKAQQQEVDDQIRIIEQHLKSLKIGTTEEIEQYERLIIELEKLRIKRGELKAQQEKEDQQNQTRKRRVTKGADNDERDVEGIFVSGSDLPNIDEGASRIESVTEGLKSAFQELGQIGLHAVTSLAEGLGGLVQNYVLLGTTGPAALRKLLAATLAQIAAESAVKAVYWTAQGIVDLFFNPARAVADFTAAGLFASIAGVSALAGRKVAGDLFKTPTTGGVGTGADGSGNGEINPLTLTRNTGQGGTPQIPPQIQPLRDRIDLHITVDENKFGKAIDAHIVEGVNNNGPIRNVLAGDGNISGR